MSDWFKIHAKSIAFVLGAVIVAIRQVTDDGTVSGTEWFIVIGALNAAVSTYIVANLTGTAGKYGKIVNHTVALTIPALIAMLPGGLTQNEWIDLIIVGGTAAGVLFLPAVQHPVNPAVLPVPTGRRVAEG